VRRAEAPRGIGLRIEEEFPRTSSIRAGRAELGSALALPNLGTLVQGFDPRPVLEGRDTPMLPEYDE